MWYLGIVDRGLVPDWIIRQAIRRRCAARLRAQAAGTEANRARRRDAFLEQLHNAPIAVHTEEANVSLRIYDVSGRLVRTMVDGFEPSGTRTVSWSGNDDQGRSVASGTYFYQLTAPSSTEKKKMVLIK